MARGRMISKSLSTSERFAKLFEQAPAIAEFAQSLYPLLVAHSDDFGRQQGDIFTVRHAVHPASPRTPTDFALALAALRDAKLIQWYIHGGREYIAIEQFDDHQGGLHKRTRSAFPAPPGISRKFPEFPESPGQLNRRELKGTEPNPTEQERAPSAPTSALLERFDQRHRERFGSKAALRRGKDAALLASVWRDRQGDAVPIEALIDAFFRSTDPWILEKGFTVGVFVSQIGKLLPALAPPPVAPQEDWFDECKRLHNRQCNGRHGHAVQMTLDAGKAKVSA